jgi:polar amino acid transport system permease protein
VPSLDLSADSVAPTAATRTLTKPRSRLWNFAQHAPRALSILSVLIIAVAVILTFIFAPGAHAFQQTFLNPTELKWTIFGNPKQNISPIWGAFAKNIELFLVAEPIILILALGVALIRNARSPLMAGPRLLATFYVDAARGLPLILVVQAVFFGFPALGLPIISSATWFEYGLFCLVFCYTAYVSEVYRAGVMSVPNSQLLAGRAVGLTEGQLLRHVTIPQAVRVVVAPLINDFVSLQKDTAIISVGAGVVELLNQVEIDQGIWFRDAPFIIAGVCFLVVCVPLTRLADALLARDLRTRLAGNARPAPRKRFKVTASAETIAEALHP